MRGTRQTDVSKEYARRVIIWFQLKSYYGQNIINNFQQQIFDKIIFTTIAKTVIYRPCWILFLSVKGTYTCFIYNKNEFVGRPYKGKVIVCIFVSSIHIINACWFHIYNPCIWISCLFLTVNFLSNTIDLNKSYRILWASWSPGVSTPLQTEAFYRYKSAV